MFAHYSLGDAALTAVLGYAVVFFGLVLLLAVIYVMGKIMVKSVKKVEAVHEAHTEKPALPAPGSAGQLKLHDVDERDAAMVMAIVAHKLGKPLNELRFRSIREVKDDEV
ncbi:MAG: OadG family protein [Oscillospiraceae bacterium]|nr:OadG family protein [Oscillospiraceae bacterium]